MHCLSYGFFFNDTAPTEIYTLSLHDSLPIWLLAGGGVLLVLGFLGGWLVVRRRPRPPAAVPEAEPRDEDTELPRRSEEHTSELQSRQYLVCRLLLEKKKKCKHSNKLDAFLSR